MRMSRNANQRAIARAGFRNSLFVRVVAKRVEKEAEMSYGILLLRLVVGVAFVGHGTQ